MGGTGATTHKQCQSRELRPDHITLYITYIIYIIVHRSNYQCWNCKGSLGGVGVAMLGAMGGGGGSPPVSDMGVTGGAV